MTPERDAPSALEEFSREFCRVVVRFERTLRVGVPGQARPLVTDTPGLGVLVALDQFGGLRPVSLAALLGMTSGGATKVVDRLERAGLVGRRTGAVLGDHRAVVVELTDAGRRALADAERLLAGVGDDFVRTIESLTGPAAGATTPGPRAPAPPGSGLAALYRFFGHADQAVLDAIDGVDVLHPSDPRPLLVLLELDHRGALPLAEVPALVDRSRAATHRLVGRLHDAGLLTRTHDRGDARSVVLARTPPARAMARRVLRSLERHLAEIEPALTELAVALRTTASRPPAADGDPRHRRGKISASPN